MKNDRTIHNSAILGCKTIRTWPHTLWAVTWKWSWCILRPSYVCLAPDRDHKDTSRR